MSEDRISGLKDGFVRKSRFFSIEQPQHGCSIYMRFRNPDSFEIEIRHTSPGESSLLFHEIRKAELDDLAKVLDVNGSSLLARIDYVKGMQQRQTKQAIADEYKELVQDVLKEVKRKAIKQSNEEGGLANRCRCDTRSHLHFLRISRCKR